VPALQLDEFGGMLPAWAPSLLPKGQASYAENGFLFSGELIGWRKPKFLRTLVNSAARMVYRVPVVSRTQARAAPAWAASQMQLPVTGAHWAPAASVVHW